MVIKVYDIVGEFGIGASDAQKLYDIIYPKLLAHKNVTLDFTGVKACMALFFNLALGKILKDITPDKFYQLVEFTGMSQNIQKLLTHILKNAEHYYYDEEYRNAVDAAMSEIALELES